jgi:hypothetical protein
MVFDVPLIVESQKQPTLVGAVMQAPISGLRWLLGNFDDTTTDSCDDLTRRSELAIASECSGSLSSTVSNSSSSLSYYSTGGGSFRKCSKENGSNSIGGFFCGEDFNSMDSFGQNGREVHYRKSGFSKIGNSRKELSWSDEMGKKLVEYGDEVRFIENGTTVGVFYTISKHSYSALYPIWKLKLYS